MGEEGACGRQRWGWGGLSRKISWRHWASSRPSQGTGMYRSCCVFRGAWGGVLREQSEQLKCGDRWPAPWPLCRNHHTLFVGRVLGGGAECAPGTHRKECGYDGEH